MGCGCGRSKYLRAKTSYRRARSRVAKKSRPLVTIKKKKKIVVKK